MSTWVSDSEGEYTYDASGYTLVVGPHEDDNTWWAYATWGYGPNVYDAEIGTVYATRSEAMTAAENWLANIEHEERIAYEVELREAQEQQVHESWNYRLPEQYQDRGK